MFDEDDYLLISGIQHFSFCRRQWALIHVESQWAENELTVGGELMHERVHNTQMKEKRGELIVSRGMPIFSRTMMIRGVCDAVEFRSDPSGISLTGRKGLWLATPVEYKHGRSKTNDADRLQLCAQAMCLEEMLLSPAIETAYLFYGETKRREEVELNAALRKKAADMFEEMRGYYDRKYTPRVRPGKHCARCSMQGVCLPEMPGEKTVLAYIRKALADDGEESI
ncbi:MAG: CRISPR-associated protein Cas4 [Clostridiales bacterium]|jgi:CRISPR-associated exonuclease Cas4|nr:CRISPR-associated protein Cas4 [Clostridiales bacterium]